MLPLSQNRSVELSHHVDQGHFWLGESAGGTNTTAVSYAAFEFRLAIERIAFEYWRTLKPGEFEEKDFRDAQSFSKIQRRIYELGGNQKVIDARFEFARLFLTSLKIDEALLTPKLAELSRFFQECSELCHFGWSFASQASGTRVRTYAALASMGDSLTAQISGLVTWAKVHDHSFQELEKKFIEGDATAEDVERHLSETGVWAKVVYNDGRPSQFLGTAIPPACKTEEREKGNKV